MKDGEDQPADAVEPAEKGERGLYELRQLVIRARKLAAGGLHASSDDPLVSSSEISSLIEAIQALNLAAKHLQTLPDFRVLHGATFRRGE